jgi:hypothetical protein
MSEQIATLIGIMHWVIYVLSLVSVAILIFKNKIDNVWRIAAIYLAIIAITQALTGGCIITYLQNYFLEQAGKPILENKFLGNYLLPSSYEIAGRVSSFIMGLILLLPIIKKGKNYGRQTIQ